LRVLQDALLEGVVALAVVNAGGLDGVEERVNHVIRDVVTCKENTTSF
jgi:hypothetical protein